MQVILQKRKIIKIVVLLIMFFCLYLVNPVYANQDEVLEAQKESLNISEFIRKSRGLYRKYF